MSRVLDAADTIQRTVRNELAGIVWHNLGRVTRMYKSTLDVTFRAIGDLMKAVSKRHDFVHRNGRDKDGNGVTVDKSGVLELIETVHSFAGDVERQTTSIVEF